MKKLQTPILAGACLCAGLIFAQSLPSTVPLATQEHQFARRHEFLGFSWQFSVNGKKYSANLSREQISAGPGWSPDSPLPLTLAKAEQMARVDLRKLVGDDAAWEVTELSLQRLRDETEPKWYYLVKLMPKHRETNVISDLFVFPISLSGEPGQVNLIRQ
ncbi:MAG TPA: hypothetical protein VFE51_13740 [Verrucomicrobiae bacterium]|nr:hypothetical protein [Verrucomicrobiae bacterium]